MNNTAMTTNKPTDKKDRDTEDLKVPAQHEMINQITSDNGASKNE